VAVALDLPRLHLVGREEDLVGLCLRVARIAPRDRHDPIAYLEARRGRAGPRAQIGDLGRCGRADRLVLPPDPEDHGHDEDGEDDVERGTGHEDAEAPPPRPAQELLGPARARLVGLVSRETDVAAERNRRDAVLGLAAPEPREARAKAEREDWHGDLERLGHDEMPELVDEDEEPGEEQERQHGLADLDEMTHEGAPAERNWRTASRVRASAARRSESDEAGGGPRGRGGGRHGGG